MCVLFSLKHVSYYFQNAFYFGKIPLLENHVSQHTKLKWLHFSRRGAWPQERLELSTALASPLSPNASSVSLRVISDEERGLIKSNDGTNYFTVCTTSGVQVNSSSDGRAQYCGVKKSGPNEQHLA